MAGNDLNQKPIESNEKAEKKPSNDGSAEKKATEEMTPQDVLRAAQAERRRIQASAQGAVPDFELVDEAKPARQERAQVEPRVKENADGSKVEMTRQADGKEHPTKVSHADGSVTTYTYDANGKPNGVTEFDINGKKVSDYKTNDGTTWTRQALDGAASQLPVQMIGRLTLDDQGNHAFKDFQNGTTLIRTAEGHLMVNNQQGRTIFKDDVTAEEKTAASARRGDGTLSNAQPSDAQTQTAPKEQLPSFLPEQQTPGNGNGAERQQVTGGDGNGAERQQVAGPQDQTRPGDRLSGAVSQDVQQTIAHIVKQGETLSEIVAKQYGLKNWNDINRVVNEIAKQNGIVNPDRIRTDQQINLPKELPPGTTGGGGGQRPGRTEGGNEQSARPRQRSGGSDSDSQGNKPAPPSDTGPGTKKPEQNFAPPMKDDAPKVEPPKETPKPEEPKVDRRAMEKAADEFYAATEGQWGTDEDKVHALLKGKTEAERKVMNEIYVKKHGMTLEQQMKNEMSGSDLKTGMDLLNKKDPEKPKPAETAKPPGDGPSTVKPPADNPTAKPQAGADAPAKPQEKPQPAADNKPQEAGKPPVDRAKMEKLADELHAATEAKWFKSDSDKVFDILKNKTEEEKKVLNEIYKQKHGKNVDDVILDNMSGDNMKRALSMYNAKDSNLTADQKARAEKAAEAIDQAANGGFLGIGTDKKAIQEQLKGKSKEEIDAINEAYKQKYGRGLEAEVIDEMSGSDKTRTIDLVKGNNDDAARINATLEEHKEWGWSARSNANTEKDLRDTLATMNEKQIQDLDKTYQERYGKSLRDVLMNDENLPADQKAALDIYLKGVDKRTPEDYTKLADLALKNKSIEMFEETFAGAPPEVRKKFLDEGGEQKIKAAFGTPMYNGSEYGGGETVYGDTADTQHALDYVKSGKLDVSTKIKDNTSWSGDNEKAIEQALKQMKPEERTNYAEGKKLADKDPATLTDAQKEQVEYYKKVHSALDGAGNDREVAKWEDMITYGKDGSLVSQLAAHGGMIDDGMGKVLGTIEGMSQEDWKRLKEDPEYRKKVEAVLAIDLNDAEMARAREALDKKLAANDFESSKNAQRSILDAVKDETGFFNNDEAGIIARLEKMTPDEQKRYREDPEFKKQVDDLVKSSMDIGAERDAAMQILDNVAKGKSAEGDIITKLNMHGSDVNTDEAKVIADIEEAFRKDPTLRERLKNPQTDEDKALAQKFDTALRRALDPGEYETYAKPLLENGRIPMEVKAQLYSGTFNDDEAGFYDSIRKGKATDADYQELLANPEKTMGFLSVEEREVALNIARQKGEMLKEDELRAAMLGAGTSEEKIKEVLDGLSNEDKAKVKEAYEKKYGSNLLGDLMGELGGQDKTEAARDLRETKDSREAYNEAREEVYQSNDGIGKAFVKNFWDGTSDMTQDQLEQYNAAMASYAKQYKEMPPEEQKKLDEGLTESLKLFQESKAAAADAVVDATIIAAGIAGASFTGGVSLSVLAYTSIGGALFKVGAKSAIMGADYDFTSAQVLTDGATGAIDAATIVLGPAQLAQMAKLGQKAAGTATTTMLAQVDDIAKATGKQLLKEGAGEKLSKEMFEQVAYAISNGAKEVDGKAMTKLAEKFAANADDVPQIQKLLVENLNTAIQKESGDALKATMREVALNSASGGVGGGLSGAVRGGVESESLDGALAGAGAGVLSGAGMAGVFTVGIKGITKGIGSAASHMPEFRLRSETPSIKVDGGEVKLNQAGRIAEATGPDGAKIKVDYHTRGELEGQVKNIKLANGAEYSSKDGVNWHVKDKTHPKGGYDVQGKMEVSSDGTVKWQAEGGNAHYMSLDGSRAEVDRVTGNTVVKSPDGRIQEVSGPTSAARYEYGADGKQLQKISFQDGSSVERVGQREGGQGEWLIKDKSSPEGRVVVGETRQLSDGTVVLLPKEGAELHIHPTGGKTQFDESGKLSHAWDSQGKEYGYKYDAQGNLKQVDLPDGSSVKRAPSTELDGAGRVTTILNESGYETKVAYGADGKITSIKDEARSLEYSTTDGVNWKVVDKSDSPRGVESHVKGEFHAKENGDLELRHPSGEVTTFRTDGNSYTTRDGEITNFKFGRRNSGNEYERTGDGTWLVHDKSHADGSFTHNGEFVIKEDNSVTWRKADGTEDKVPADTGGWSKRHANGNGSSFPHEGNVIVGRDGSVSFPHDREHIEVRRMDGGVEFRTREGRLVNEIPPEGAPKRFDVDGRPTDGKFRHKIQEKFGDLSDGDVQRAIVQVKDELKAVKAIGPDGKPTSAYDSLMKDPTLSDAQKDNILRNLTEVREHFAKYRQGDRMHPDPEVNWIHTQGELAKVLEAGRAKKLSPQEMEDALLASMYSDSVKFAFPPPTGAEANFFTHHLDGALAASENLSKQGFPQERIDRIVQAIKEHQIAPPEFMAKLYHFKMSSGIAADLNAGKITADQSEKLTKLLTEMSETGPDGALRIKHIAHPLDAPKYKDANGQWQVEFSNNPNDAAGVNYLLNNAGIKEWTVPVDPRLDPNFKQLSKVEQDKLLSTYKISQTLIDGDGIDNYATLGGASKIVAIRGPGTGFKDAQVWNSIDSIDSSYKDAYNVLSPEGRKLADATLAERNAILHDKDAGIRAQMDEWLKAKGLDPAKDKIPFYNSDLKYPDALSKEETGALEALRKKTGLSADEAAEMRKLQYKGMSEQEIKDFEFAKQIRQEMTDQLRRGHRTDGNLPGKFERVTRDFGANAKSDNPFQHMAEPRALELPNGLKQSELPAGVTTAGDVHIIKAPDNSIMVQDLAKGTSKSYDANGRVTEVFEHNNNRKFAYDADGKLSQVEFGDGTVWKKEGNGWTFGSHEGTKATFRGDVVVDADGTVKTIDNGALQKLSTDGSRENFRINGRVDYLQANYQLEGNRLSDAVTAGFADQPARVERFNKLREQFEAEAAKRGLTENDKALLYKQLNRLMAENPAAPIPLADRMNLAEQILNHSTFPENVSQGANGTCNVTTLEHRNYMRNPDKNAQAIADIATTGKYTFADGKSIDMTQLDNGIKPDVQARNALSNQVKKGGDASHIHVDGERDYSSQLIETAMANHGWRDETILITSEGRRINQNNFVYGADKKLLGMVDNTEKDLVRFHDKDGNRLTTLLPGQEVYTKDKKLIQNFDPDKVVYDQYGSVRGMVPGEIKQMYGVNGEPLEKFSFVPGNAAYDKNGKMLVTKTRPGELTYDRIPDGTGSAERVYYNGGKEPIAVRDEKGKLITHPEVSVTELQGISEAVTGKAEKPFVISFENYPNSVSVRSKEELLAAFEQMKKDNNLPAVLMVNVFHPPFGNGKIWPEAGDGWHVITLHSIYELEKQVGDMEVKYGAKFVNQWRKKDNMDIGLTQIFQALEPPPPPPAPVKAANWRERARNWFKRDKGGDSGSGEVAALPRSDHPIRVKGADDANAGMPSENFSRSVGSSGDGGRRQEFSVRDSGAPRVRPPEAPKAQPVETLLKENNLAVISGPGEPLKVMLNGHGNVDSTIDGVIRSADGSQKTIILDWNGAEFEIKPGMTRDQAKLEWKAATEARSKSPEVLAANQRHQEQAARELAAGRAEVDGLRGTPHRKKDDLIAQVYEDAHARGMDPGAYAMENLKHPDEIRDFVQYYAGKNPDTVIDNLEFTVGGGRIYNGSEGAWREAIDELKIKGMPEVSNSTRIAEVETQFLLKESFRQQNLEVISPLSSLTDPNQALRVMYTGRGKVDDGLAAAAKAADDWNRPVRLDWNGTDVEVRPGQSVGEAHAAWEASFRRDVSPQAAEELDQFVGGRKVKGLWAPERDFDKLTIEERGEVYSLLDGKSSPLSDFAVADSFSEKAMKSIDGWKQDLGEMGEEVRRLDDLRQKATGKYMELLNHEDYPMSKWHDVEFSREFYANDPDKLAIIDEHVRIRDEYWKKGWELDDALKQRTATLQKQLDEFADEQGLPRVTIKLRDSEHMGSARASYDDDGIITLNKKDLYNDKNGSRLIGSLYHEFTHSEQQSLVVGKLADQAGIGRTVTDADVKRVAELYKEQVGRAPSEEHLKTILEARSRRADLNLSEDEIVRADAMTEAWKKNKPVGDRYRESENDFRVARGELKKLMNEEHPSAPSMLMDRLYSPKGGKNLSKRLFGTEQPPPEVEAFYKRYLASMGDTDTEIAAKIKREPIDELSLDFTKGPEIDLGTGAVVDPHSLDFTPEDLDFTGGRLFDGLDDDARADLFLPETQKEAGRVMRKAIQGRMEEINAWREKAYDDYMQMHEVDAWLSGEKARSSATRHGAIEGDELEIDGMSWKVDPNSLDQMRGSPIQAFDGRLSSDTPVVTRDTAGRVTESVDGSIHHKYTYGKDGGLDSVNIEGGMQAQRQSDGTWLVKGDPHHHGREYVFDGEMKVTKLDGSVWKESPGGNLEVYKTDGSTEINFSDGSSVYKGADGKVTGTEYRNGTTRSDYGYGPDGSLTSITRGDGYTATKQDDGTWLIKGDPEAHGQDYTFRGDFEVMSLNGSLNKRFEGGTIETFDVDGSSSVMFGDGGSIVRNAEGKVTGTEFRHGTQRADFEYSQSGELTRVTQKNGFTAENQGDGTWLITGDPSANNGGQPYIFDGDIEVMKAGGSVWKTSRDGGLVETFNLDGSKTVSLSDGSHISSDASGRVTGTQYRNGEQRADFGYAENGKLNSVNIEDRFQAVRQSDGSWTITHADGSVEIHEGEIKAMRSGSVWKEPPRGQSRPTEVFEVDGSRSVINPDGGSVQFDAAGRVTSTEYRNGGRRTFQYDVAGNLDRVEADGNILARDSRGWALIDNQNRIITPFPEMQIRITDGGDIEMTGTSSADKVIRHLDGTVDEVNPKPLDA